MKITAPVFFSVILISVIAYSFLPIYHSQAKEKIVKDMASGKSINAAGQAGEAGAQQQASILTRVNSAIEKGRKELDSIPKQYNDDMFIFYGNYFTEVADIARDVDKIKDSNYRRILIEWNFAHESPAMRADDTKSRSDSEYFTSAINECIDVLKDIKGTLK